MPEMLSAECDTNNKSPAKKDGHEHFYLVALCSQSIPPNESSETQNDEAAGAKQC
jgi:hypothetical protein